MGLDMSIDRNLLSCLLQDGIEWACRGFWAQVEAYDGVPDEDTPGFEDLPDDTVLASLRDDEDGMAEAEGRPFVDITFANMREATLWALVEYNHLFPRYEVEGLTITDIDYDAIGADVILQRIVLGNVVYG